MFGDAAVGECRCEPGAVIWIWRLFCDCVYTSSEMVGFLVGISSVFFWFFAQMPQFVINILRQRADALSPWFLFQWLAGDICNLLGCLFTGNQLATQTVTAFYFVFADCGIISQYIYYQVRNRDKKDHYPYSSHLDVAAHSTAFVYKDAMFRLECDPKQNALKGAVQDWNLMVVSDTSHNDCASSGHVSYVSLDREIILEQESKLQKAQGHETEEDLSKSEQLRKQEPPLILEEGICVRQSADLNQTLSTSKLDHQSRQTSVVSGRCFQQAVDVRHHHHHRRKKSLFLPPKKQLGPCKLHRHLCRVVLDYGLEYGPPLISRLNTNHILRIKKIDFKRLPEKLEKKPSFPLVNPNLKRQLGLAASAAVGLSECHLAEGSSLLQNSSMKIEHLAEYFGRGSGTITGGRVLKGVNRVMASSREVWNSTAVLHLLHTSDEGTLFLPCSGNSRGILWTQHIGLLFGWTSAILYLGSRVSQLMKNSQRRSAEGLSLGMVTCAVCANLTYGLAILLRTNSWQDIADKAPWVIGSLGTVSLDICIFMQAQYFKYHCKAKDPSNYTPLLA